MLFSSLRLRKAFFDRVSLRREKGRGADDLDVGTLSSKSFTMEETHASLSHDTNDI